MKGAGGKLGGRPALVGVVAVAFVVILAALAWLGGAGRPGGAEVVAEGPGAYGRAPATYKERVTSNPGLSYTENYATARCDPGDKLLSGGFSAVDEGTVVVANAPDTFSSAEAWLVGWENDASPDAVEVTVLCAEAAFPPHE